MSQGLSAYAKAVTAQSGEDGIIEEIFDRIGTSNKVCVEFGAGDGKEISNTWDLWCNKDWKATLIECDKEKFNRLKDRVAENSNVTPIHAFITICGENSLDETLARCDVPRDFDLLSIDIDGDDYYVFEGMQHFIPRVVVIEYNATIPHDIYVVQKEGSMLGASALALCELARRKSYRLVACTKTNCIFVHDSAFASLGIEEARLEEVFPKDALTYVITTFDGQVLFSRRPWHLFGLEKLSLIRLLKNMLKTMLRGKKKTPLDQEQDALLPVTVFGEKDITFK